MKTDDRTALEAKWCFLATMLLGCGPDVEPEAEIQNWMLGTYSSDLPAEYLPNVNAAYRTVVHDDLTLELQEVGEAGLRNSSERRWGPVDGSTFRFFLEGEQPEEADYWFEVTRTDDCAILEIQDVRPSTGWSGPLLHLYRGVICYEDITEPCAPEETECGVVGRLYWCEEPPPCDDE